MIKHRIIILLISLLLTVIVYVFIQFNNANDIEHSCLISDFEEAFEKENSLVLNKIYDFSKILKCNDWDEVIIVGGPNACRAAIFLKEGVAVPEIDYSNRISGCLLFYFIKERELICPPIEFWHSDFLYFKDLNDCDYLSLSREKAVFKCIELDYLGPKDKEVILTFELIDK